VKTLLNDLTNKQKALVDLVVDAGTLPRNRPSTVIDLTESSLKVLRQGDVELPSEKKYVSRSPEETRRIARQIFEENKTESKPLVFIIEGELGVGKTIFVKGVGEALGIKKIISPTFVLYYEYGDFYHFDLYQVEDKEELTRLKIDKMLKPGRVLCFEWGEKIGEIYTLVKDKAKVVYVKMEYTQEGERKISINL
jgi:tRNA threonylcarbamoyl adenosine modification protein YjeE